MRPLAPDRTELALPDGKPPLTPQQAAVEANRCLGCTEAPCIRAFPTGIDIPGFIRRIAPGNVRGAARVVVDALRRAGKDLTREKMVSTLEGTSLDLGGFRVSYSPNSRLGSRYVELTVVGPGGKILK